MLTALQTAP